MLLFFLVRNPNRLSVNSMGVKPNKRKKPVINPIQEAKRIVVMLCHLPAQEFVLRYPAASHFQESVSADFERCLVLPDGFHL